ncbi:hypothetical protein CRYUN_Cryun04dG0161400 [Craigia yunnanensis]
MRTLDLSSNMISGEINEFIEALAGCSNNTLDYLDLSSNNLEGNLPDSLGFLKYLGYLRLAQNSFSGSLPKSKGNLSSLKVLDLSFNSMNGTILESIGQLTRLYELNLYGNLWEGIIRENHFQNLSRLSSFSLSFVGKSVIFNLRRDWIPIFSLDDIAISNCQLGPIFPTWLRTQVDVSQLTLSSGGISDIIPDWFWSLTSRLLWWVDLSDNQLSGKLPDSGSFCYVVGAWVDLGFNLLEGSIPLWPNVTNLSLRNNSFSGPIPSNIGQILSQVVSLDLSRNFLNDSIPASINKMENLSFLDLSCGVPSSLYALPSLIFLKLGSNNLSGELSNTLQNCSGLLSIDLGENRFPGTIPDFVSDNLFLLSYLGLRVNILTGSIPEKLCVFPNLHIIDLAQNNLSGAIPKCLGNLLLLIWVLISMNYPQPSTYNSYSTCTLFQKQARRLFFIFINLPALVQLRYRRTLETCNGQIPRSNQFQTFNDPSIYQGNPELWGPPLSTSCSSLTNGHGEDKNGDLEGEDRSENFWFYISMGLGSAIGFGLFVAVW